MRSMTGYGGSTAALGNVGFSVNVSSVNRKSLDLTVSLPSEWEVLESEVIDQVRKSATRGKVHLSIEINSKKKSDEEVWDDEYITAALDKLSTLAEAQGVTFNPSADLLWQIANSKRKEVTLPAPDLIRPMLLEAVDTALNGMVIMREKEGEALLVDFITRVTLLRRLVDSIGQRAPHVAPTYRELLLKRLREANLELDISDERVLKEVALFADRCDITEEITRFKSHIDQFTNLIKSETEMGRKAEFILQEMGREVHTMGSKANDLEIAKHIIELKNELERVKEQIANVE
ncbi:MAG: YicC/YloC family endoribonuclease [Verrucomicrobiota bacterium]|nr:MAG: YicC family protein [Verrucomicrobiota bacterium]